MRERGSTRTPRPFGRALAPALALLWAGCATPLPPSGGPVDQTPPALVAAEPAAGAVRVSAGEVTLEFSEAVDEASARRALSVAPPPATPPEVSARGRRLTVAFPDGLRDSTTYVLTFGRELKDERGVALSSPIQLAFSTGDALDRGAVAGALRRPDTGRGVGEWAVFAYRLGPGGALPDPRAAAPDYRTQTDAEGRFRLGYLRRGAYFVAAVEDRNRNGRADAGEGFAVPPRRAVEATAPEPADTSRLAASDTSLTLWAARVDTLAPEPRRVRPSANARLAVRFSEPVRLRDPAPAAWTLRDTTGAAFAVRTVYADPADSAQVVLTTTPLAPATYRLTLARTAAVTDTAGNAAVPDTLRFTAPDRPDTLRARFEAFAPQGQLRPGQRPGIRFSAPPDSAAIAARLTVADTLGSALRYRLVRRSALLELAGIPAAPFRVSWRAEDTTFARTFAPVPAEERGELSGVVRGADAPVWVEVRPEGDGLPTRVRADSTGAFLIPDLPAGPYALRAWADRDGDGRWSPGALAPYQPAEPLVLLPDGARVRARWTVELEPIALPPVSRPEP